MIPKKKKKNPKGWQGEYKEKNYKPISFMIIKVKILKKSLANYIEKWEL